MAIKISSQLEMKISSQRSQHVLMDLSTRHSAEDQDRNSPSTASTIDIRAFARTKNALRAALLDSAVSGLESEVSRTSNMIELIGRRQTGMTAPWRSRQRCGRMDWMNIIISTADLSTQTMRDMFPKYADQFEQ
jgi:hypothetical protein